jgi:energy-coupling factor transporter ATP-binding protein EcfA2
MNKIEKIENLNSEEFINVICKVISAVGYKEVENLGNNLIISNNVSPLSSEKYLFVYFPFRLIGNIDSSEIKNILIANQQKTSANALYVVSNSHISKGFEESLTKEHMPFKINFIGRDRFIKLIDEHYPEFWRHNDLLLIAYEKQFAIEVSQETELRKLKYSNEKCQKLLNIYIEPRLYHFYEDRITKTAIRKRVDTDYIITDTKSSIISGAAGSGKSTLLKRIGQILIEKNTEILEGIRNLPLYISASDIFNNNYKILKIIEKKLAAMFNESLDELAKAYKIHLLFDSIDEFDDENQKSISKQLQEIEVKLKIKYYLGTRNSDRIISLFGENSIDSFSIERFNIDQVKRFISTFFLGDEFKANNLLDALRENKIIDKLPITPLTLSLISILYEENDFEIPATITDIYDNFNALIIGRSIVSSKIDFIDISFKERILSLYALEILQSKEHIPFTKDQFIRFFRNYYAGKTLPIKEATLEEVLDYIVKNTGILFIKDDRWIQFSHDSYMEYYAALEIFKHQRLQKEQELIDNFFDPHWQNAAIFYAGKSKDMPDFIKKITEKLTKANQINHYLSGILGSGYLLQALYQTDNILRRDMILESLELVVKANDVYMKLASDDFPMFRNYKIPILQLMNVFFFYETFNSITVKEPLKLSFKELMEQYRFKESASLGFKLIQLAFTLDSKRINENSELEEVINTNIMKEPSLLVLTELAIDLLGKEKYKEFKNELKKKYYNLDKLKKRIVELPASKLRFSNLDTISSNKEVTLIVEGKTDAEIIEHAYYVLTNGQSPYWKINISGNNGETGSAHEVNQTLSNAFPLLDNTKCIIGILDHDSAGLQNFNGLKETIFSKIKNGTIKKHVKGEIYALCLPIPGEMDNYLQTKQEFNFFEIEHYFGIEFLTEKKILKETPIPNVYEIYKNKKVAFSSEIRKLSDPQIFRFFMDLFKEIDFITKVDIEYIY